MSGVEIEVTSPIGSLHSQVESDKGGQLPEISPRLAWKSKLLVTPALIYREELGELETFLAIRSDAKSVIPSWKRLAFMLAFLKGQSTVV